MGWPKKNEGLRLYFERKGKSFLLVDPEARLSDGSYETIGETLIENDPQKPKLSSGSASPGYLHTRCRRASWGDMPRVWQEALKAWLTRPPEEYRGLWRIAHP